MKTEDIKAAINAPLPLEDRLEILAEAFNAYISAPGSDMYYALDSIRSRFDIEDDWRDFLTVVSEDFNDA